MGPHSFDSLTLSLANAKSRRGFLGTLAALGAGLLGARASKQANAHQVSQASCGNVTCKSNPGKCNPGCVCCVYGNGNSRCRPPGTCSGGTEVGPTTPPPTTTTAPTTTTTTTATTTSAPSPDQGTCETGEEYCNSTETINCNGTGCLCDVTTSGQTVCRDQVRLCIPCTTDFSCLGALGQVSYCFNSTEKCDCSSGDTFCAIPCPSPA